MNWFRPAKKRIKPTSAQPQTFILEPLITPSGLVEELPDPALLQVHSVSIEDISLPDSTLAHGIGLESAFFHHSSSEYLEQMEFRSLEIPEPIEPSFNAGVFTVGASGQVNIDFLFDGGGYQGEVAIFSLEGMNLCDLDTPDGMEQFIQTAAARAHSDSVLGHVVISDATEGAKFSPMMGEDNQNSGVWKEVKTFEMQAGGRFAVMLVPNGTVEAVLNGSTHSELRPLFSLATANPNDHFHLGQIADVTGDGNTFVFEDLRVDGETDQDYNDVVFQIRGATGEAQHLDEVINPHHDWRTTEMGKSLLEYTKPYVASSELLNSIPQVPLPESPLEQQPLVGIIDTGFNAHNPNLDYSHITVGHDYVQGDNDSLLEPGQDGEHGTHVLGVIGATQGDDIETDGINPQAPLWVSRAVGSGQWADSLVEFVDAAKASAQPNAVVNLSFDLTQINPDGSIATRYELTSAEWSALEYARQNHVLIVVAAGNDGSTMSALGQASQVFDNIITTGAAHTTHTEDSVAQDFDRTDYSSFGYGLDLVAEGGTIDQPILSTVGDDFGTMAGTSVAAAQVTGTASQVWAANPDLSYRQVIDILKSTATDLKLPDWDLETGSGLLNIAAAVHLAKVTQAEDYTSFTPQLPDTWGDEFLAGERAVTIFTQPKPVEWIASPNFNDRPGGAKDVTSIIYHHTGSANIDSPIQQFKNPATKVSSHYIIGTDGRIVQMVDTAKRAWHAGTSALDGRGDVNNFSIGIEIVNLDGNQYNYTEAQYKSLQWLTQDLLKKYPSITRLTGHQDVAPKEGKIDPGSRFDWNQIAEAARGVSTTPNVTRKVGRINNPIVVNPVQAPPVTPTPTPNWQRAIDQAYANSPVNLGSAISGYMDASRSPQGTTGKYRTYQNGTIHWTQQHGAIPIWFDLQREYSQYSQPNGSAGWLGFPTRREYDWNGGKRTDFEGGYIFWNGQRAKAYRPGEMPPGTQPTRTGRVNARVGSVPLNFRSSAAVASNNKIGELSIGTSFKILEQVNGGSYSTDAGNRTDWLKIQLNSGQQGYVAGYYVDIDSNNGGGGGNTGGAMTREGFINWATGQVGIRRLDGYANLRGQCVTLIARYVQEVFLSGSEQTRNRAFGNGKDTASVLAGMLPNSFEPYTRAGLPRRGAVISFPGPDTTYGHTAIVMESRTFNGQRQVRIMDSNGDNRGVNSTVREYYSRWINIDSSGNGYGGTNGWTNPR